VFAFSHVVGHRRLTTLLSQAIERRTLPPTLMFVGPGGVGKHRVARTVASVLNCLAPVAGAGGLAVDACGKCRSCDRIARGVHVDVLTLEPDDRASIKIDVVREVLSGTAFRPFEGRRRVVVIADADTLEPAAQNALLKSLEEPPPSTGFLLTTAVPGLLLPTVRSRCMRLRFGRLTEGEVVEVLTRDHEFSARDASAAAALADGSVGLALALGSTDLALIHETALLLLRQTAGNATTAARLQAAGTLAAPSRKDRPREEVALVLRAVASMLRDIELLNSGGDRHVLANPGLSDELHGLTRAFAGERARDAFASIDRAIMALDRNAGTKVVSDWVATQL
jgi:DNA polymerase-3 subunit delta'